VGQMTPAFGALARQLLAHETEGAQDPAELAEATERVCRKLYERLTKLIGPEGFSSLLDRPLHLAKVERRALKPVVADTTVASSLPNACTLKGLRESTQGREPGEVREDLVTLVGSFIWLLAVFVGEDLAHRQLRKTWPGVDFGEGVSDSEEAKR